MNVMDFEQYAEGLIKTAKAIAAAKRPEYTCGSTDVHANFKRIAERTGLSAAQVLTVYLLKHIDSITAMLARGADGAEPLEDRLADAINYLLLAGALQRTMVKGAMFVEVGDSTSATLSPLQPATKYAVNRLEFDV